MHAPRSPCRAADPGRCGRALSRGAAGLVPRLGVATAGAVSLARALVSLHAHQLSDAHYHGRRDAGRREVSPRVTWGAGERCGCATLSASEGGRRHRCPCGSDANGRADGACPPARSMWAGAAVARRSRRAARCSNGRSAMAAGAIRTGTPTMAHRPRWSPSSWPSTRTTPLTARQSGRICGAKTWYAGARWARRATRRCCWSGRTRPRVEGTAPDPSRREDGRGCGGGPVMRYAARLQRLEQQVLVPVPGPSLVEVLAATVREKQWAVRSLWALVAREPLPVRDATQAAADQALLAQWRAQQGLPATPDPAALPRLLEQLATIRQRQGGGS